MATPRRRGTSMTGPAGPTRRAMLRAAQLLALVALLFAGCSLVNRSPLEVTLPASNDFPPLPVRLIDHSNTVTALELPIAQPNAPAGAEGDEFAAPVPGRPNAVAVAWLGGACDQQVDLEFTGGDATFTVTTTSGQGGCFLIGIPRSMIVVFGAPIDAAAVQVHQNR